MSPTPYRPLAELGTALDRGNLRHAIILAADVAEERNRPIDLDLALRFLPLVAAQQPEQFDAWALRWLGRWINETLTATIEHAAEVAGALADLPAEPTSFEAIRGAT